MPRLSISALSQTQKTVGGLVAIVLVMGAVGFAAAPLYSWFCRVTGYGGTTAVAEDGAGPDTVLDRVVSVRFDANTSPDLQWRFRPVQREMKLKIGETGLAFYEATNIGDRPIAGTASYNVAPFSAGGYFTKIDCFCFTLQVLQPGETVQMPVTFYVDPEMVDDLDAKYVTTITLSYTFYETDMPEGEDGDAAGAAPARPAASDRAGAADGEGTKTALKGEPKDGA